MGVSILLAAQLKNSILVLMGIMLTFSVVTKLG